MVYVLKTEKQMDVLRLLVEGNSISSVSRLTRVHRDTCTRLMQRFGTGCRAFLDREMRDLQLSHLQLDEIWTFVRKKGYNITGLEPDLDEIGSVYLFVAFDADTKLIPSFRLDRRTAAAAQAFLLNLAGCLKMPKAHASDQHAFQHGQYVPVTRISTDAFPGYVDAVDMAFGPYAVFGQLKKVTKGKGADKHVDITKAAIKGSLHADDISTSLVERNNLTLRTFIRRFTRKSMGYSKKLANLRAAVRIHMAHYNYCWVHKTIKTTPAVAAGIIGERWKLLDLYEHIRDGWPELFW